MRLEDIKYFLSVVETGNIGRAAIALSLSQPAITKGIQRLEGELGIQLFERHSNGVRLTELGKHFQHKLSNIALQVEDTLKEANDIHHGALGLIRIGVTPLLLDGFFNDVCTKVLKKRPACRFSLTINMPDALFPDLLAGNLDLVISTTHNIENFEGLNTCFLFYDNLHVICGNNHPILSLDNIQISDLTKYGWALPGERIGARRWLIEQFRKLGLPEPTVVLQTNTTMTNLIPILDQTDLLSMASEITLRSNISNNLATIDLDSVTWKREIGLHYRKNGYLSPICQYVKEAILDHAKLH